MGIFFTDKVEHRHGSKKVSRKTAKIEMKIKQEELKQLKQQTRQQEWERLQQARQAQQQYKLEQQYIQQQYKEQQQQQYEQYKAVQEPTVDKEKLAEVNKATLDKIQEQQTKLTELLAYKEYLMANKPNTTKLEGFMVCVILLIMFFTLPTIIIPLITLMVGGSILGNLDTELNKHNKEVTRVNNEIKATQKTIQVLSKSVVKGL